MCCLCTPFSYAQDYKSEQLEVLFRGESKSQTKNLHIDSEGFYWYATFGGVLKELGGSSTFFPLHHPNNIPNLKLLNLFKSSSNILWISSDAGICKLDLNTGNEVWFFAEKTVLKDGRAFMFQAIYEAANQDVWISSNAGTIYRFRGEVYKEFTVPDPGRIVPDNAFLGNFYHPRIVYELSDASFVLKVHNDWFHFKNEGLIPLVNQTNRGLSQRNSSGSLMSHNGEIFPKNNNGTYRFLNKAYHYWYLPSIDKHIFEIPFRSETMLQVSKKHKEIKGLYVNYEKALYQLNFSQQGSDIVLRLDKKLDFETNANFIISHNKNIVAIDQDHITCYKLGNLKVHQNNFQDDYNQSCRRFYQNSKGDIYLNTVERMLVKKNEDSVFSPLIFRPKKSKESKEFKRNLFSFHPLNDSTLLGYGYGYGNLKVLPKINLQSKTVENLNADLQGVGQFLFLYDIETINEKSILVAGDNGIVECNLNTKIAIDRSQISPSINLSNKKIRDLYFNPKRNELWIGTQNEGLYLIQQESNTVFHFSKEDSAYPLCDNSIEYIFEDSNHMVWIATRNGLQRINPETLVSQEVTTNIGSDNKHIVGILEDIKNNALWLSTYTGLLRYNTLEDSFQTFNKNVGIVKNEYNAKSFLKASDSLFYFGGINGYVYFNPLEVSERTEKPTLHLTSVSQYNPINERQEGLIFGLDTLRSFTLEHDQTYIKFQFAINDVFESKNSVLKYQIKEISKQWYTLGEDKSLSLKGIRAGDYTLKVKGYNHFFSPTPALQYTIKVKEVFYKTPLFLVPFLLMLSSFGVFGLLKVRSKLRVEIVEKNKIKHLEAKILQASMNPHFIFNSLNGIQAALFTKGQREANKYITRFSKLLRLNIEMSQDSTITLTKEIAFLRSYIELEYERLNGVLDFDIVIDDQLNTDHLMLPNMLLQPLVENAIIHGLSPKKENRKLDLRFMLENKHLVITVADNGVGRKSDANSKKRGGRSYTSLAYKIMKDRISITNGLFGNNIHFEIMDLQKNGTAAGTIVTVHIPIEFKT